MLSTGTSYTSEIMCSESPGATTCVRAKSGEGTRRTSPGYKMLSGCRSFTCSIVNTGTPYTPAIIPRVSPSATTCVSGVCDSAAMCIARRSSSRSSFGALFDGIDRPLLPLLPPRGDEDVPGEPNAASAAGAPGEIASDSDASSSAIPAGAGLWRVRLRARRVVEPFVTSIASIALFQIRSAFAR
eukprot:31310-Pelagococcus_subviridis.AAC.12